MRFKFIPLEERIVLDAAVMGDAVDALDSEDGLSDQSTDAVPGPGEVDQEEGSLIDAVGAAVLEPVLLVLPEGAPSPNLDQEVIELRFSPESDLNEIIQLIENELSSRKASSIILDLDNSSAPYSDILDQVDSFWENLDSFLVSGGVLGFTGGDLDLSSIDNIESQILASVELFESSSNSNESLSGFDEEVSTFAGETIGNSVWYDVDGDGHHQGDEPGIAGATVNLYNSTGTTLLQTTTTDANGIYSFNVTPGDYILEFLTPSGFVAPTHYQTSPFFLDSDADRTTGRTEVVNVPLDANINTIDAGFVTDSSSSLSNFVWNDVNGNGIQDFNEPGIDGVAIDIYNARIEVVASTVTSGGGFYLVDNLPSAEYIVYFDFPATGFTGFTTRDAGGDDTIDSDAEVSGGIMGESPRFTLGAFENNSTIDAGLISNASISGLAWDDVNGNGLREGGEALLSGVTVNILDSGLNLVSSTVTDGSGAYTFNAMPGTYTIEFIAPGGTSFSPQDVGGNNTIDSDANTSNGRTTAINLSDSSTVTNVDAGFTDTSSGTLGNFVWYDVDGDGYQDGGELGISGATVNLYNSTGTTLLQTTTTDANGVYSFTVDAGNYVLEFVTPSGFVAPTHYQVSPFFVDSDANRTTGRTTVINMPSGGTINNIDAGFVTDSSSSISDFVWNDVNGNGIQDFNEPGIDGVVVDLYNERIEVVASTVTSGGGFYLFDNLPSANYIVYFDLPATGFTGFTTRNSGGNDNVDSDANPSGGTLGESPQIVLGAFENNSTVDAGLISNASISGLAWDDANGNGLREGGEALLSGVTVNILDSGLNLVSSTVTDGSGAYTFNAVAGTYTIEFVAPGGTSFTPQDVGSNNTIDSDANTANGRTAAITIFDGNTVTNVDAGFTDNSLGTFGNFVWHDVDGDGYQDGAEPGISGATVNLYNSTGTTLLQTTTTDANGIYSFTVDAGDYVLEFVTPSGFVAPTHYQVSPFFIDSDANRTTGRTAVINMPSGGTIQNIDAGFVTNSSSSLSNFVWNDVNGNGIQDFNEPGIDGVAIDIYNERIEVVASTVTSGGGFYLIDNLPSADYIVYFDLPATGFTGFTTRNSGGDDTIDSDAEVSGGTIGESPQIALGAFENDSTVDAGLISNASISGLAWDDVNGNGLREGGEALLSGVTVNILDSGLNLVSSTVTDGSGAYTFNAMPGTYTIEFIAPGETLFSPQDAGTNDTIDSDANTTNGRTAAITLSDSSTVTNVDAGFTTAGTLGNYVWHDVDGDGYQDGAEPGISGATVNLYDETGTTLLQTTTTDANGIYSFTVAAGNYVLEFVTPSGFAAPTHYQVSPFFIDSDANRTTGRTAVINMPSGGTINNIDAGFVTDSSSSISDFVWNDVNGNGIQDFNEPGIDGIVVDLYNERIEVVASTVTSGGGFYLFDNLPSADYIVYFDLPTRDFSGFTTRNTGVDDTIDSDANESGSTIGQSPQIILGVSENNSTVDAGLLGNTNISGLVWDDLNADGLREGGETLLSGITVNILDSGLNLISSTVTDGSGAYTFNVVSGTYTIEFVLPAGALAFTDQDVGADDTIDSDVNIANGRTTSITVGENESITNVDAGLYFPATISGTFWDDLNADGIRDPGEPFLEGVEIELHTASGGLIATQLTDASGQYSFTGLRPDQY
ncbi:MAG: hypothetical protein CMO81_08715, partial [Waddliaceae bacterium]|nr:hypothetical protein [Waddliaceae bacterium]